MIKNKEKDVLRHVFIGYDEREESAYQVAKYSIESQLASDRPKVQVHKLDHRTLRSLGLFDRTWTIVSDGSYRDNTDKRPFSTQFAHSRFLIPALCKLKGLKGQALFMDCDFLVKGDINDLFDLTENNGSMVSMVKHDFVPKNEMKMDNCSQKAYSFKLWSALMMFNLKYKKLYELLEPTRVNSWEGGALHRFMWISQSHNIVQSEVGEIPEAWQFIPDHSEPRVDYKDIRIIHYTEGGPWFPHMEDCKYSKDWWKEYALYIENNLFPYVEKKAAATHAKN